MTSALPFRDYRKDQLPRGFSYVVGRDVIADALRSAGADIGLLPLSRPHMDPRQSQAMLFDVYWKGDGGTRVFGRENDDDPGRLLMRWNAVPSDMRRQLEADVVGRWLPEACEWAALAPGRGNVWRATDRRWLLWRSGRRLSVEIS